MLATANHYLADAVAGVAVIVLADLAYRYAAGATAVGRRQPVGASTVSSPCSEASAALTRRK